MDTHYQGEVTVLIHPNGMTIGSEESFQIAGKIVGLTFRGNTCRMTLEKSGTVLNFDFLSSEMLPKIGDTIYLNFDPSQSLHLFSEPFHSITP
jgi:ABC-type Fe3+/spermidine/putrescine transport system ATPase subunit